MTTTSNLPPGCSVGDIPGNRPEELAAEARWNRWFDQHPIISRLCEILRGDATNVQLGGLIASLGDATGDAFETAIERIYLDGFAQGAEQMSEDLSNVEEVDRVAEAILEGHQIGRETAAAEMYDTSCRAAELNLAEIERISRENALLRSQLTAMINGKVLEEIGVEAQTIARLFAYTFATGAKWKWTDLTDQEKLIVSETDLANIRDWVSRFL